MRKNAVISLPELEEVIGNTRAIVIDSDKMAAIKPGYLYKQIARLENTISAYQREIGRVETRKKERKKERKRDEIGRWERKVCDLKAGSGYDSLATCN